MLGFNVVDEGVVDVPMWVEFLGLPILLWRFLKSLGESIGQFVCFELERFFSAQSSLQVCVKVDLTCDLPKFVDINIGEEGLRQRVEFIGLPNTCYRCQSLDHKICA